jgi:hypothetical protein
METLQSPVKETEKMDRGMARAIECLPSKYKAMSSNPNTTKKKKRKKETGNKTKHSNLYMNAKSHSINMWG